MKRQALELIIEWDVDVRTLSPSKNWDGDQAFSTCDWLGERTMTDLVSWLDLDGQFNEAELDSDLAYVLYGMAGAY